MNVVTPNLPTNFEQSQSSAGNAKFLLPIAMQSLEARQAVSNASSSTVFESLPQKPYQPRSFNFLGVALKDKRHFACIVLMLFNFYSAQMVHQMNLILFKV